MKKHTLGAPVEDNQFSMHAEANHHINCLFLGFFGANKNPDLHMLWRVVTLLREGLPLRAFAAKSELINVHCTIACYPTLFIALRDPEAGGCDRHPYLHVESAGIPQSKESVLG